MSVQILERDGNPEWAVIPYKEYLQLVAEAEMLQDVRDYDTTLERLKKARKKSYLPKSFIQFWMGRIPSVYGENFAV